MKSKGIEPKKRPKPPPPPAKKAPSLKRPSRKRMRVTIPDDDNDSDVEVVETKKLDSPHFQRKTIQPSTPKAGSLAAMIQSAKEVSSNDTALGKTYTADDFWKILRDWDILSAYNNQICNQEEPRTKPLPDKFTSASHYRAAWAPLCTAECQAQLLQEFVMSEGFAVTTQVSHRKLKQREKEYLNVQDLGTTTHVQLKCSRSSNVQLTNNDIIVLMEKDLRQAIQQGTAVPPSGKALTDLHAFASCACIAQSESMHKGLDGVVLTVSKRKWATAGSKHMVAVPLGTVVTHLREFTALCQVNRLPLLSNLLGQHLEHANSRRKLSRNQSAENLLQMMGGTDKLGDGFVKHCRSKFNPSQLTAIAASAHEYGKGGFTLIKGPPGTGSKSIANPRDIN